VYTVTIVLMVGVEQVHGEGDHMLKIVLAGLGYPQIGLVIGYIADHCGNYQNWYDDQRQNQRKQFPAKFEVFEKVDHCSSILYTSVFSMIYLNMPPKSSRYAWRKADVYGMVLAVLA
jgi:hypothetical protein